MNFDDALSDTGGAGAGSCKVATILAALDADNRGQLTAALDGPKSSLRISAALGRMGIQVSDSTVWKHRHGQCRCG